MTFVVDGSQEKHASSQPQPGPSYSDSSSAPRKQNHILTNVEILEIASDAKSMTDSLCREIAGQPWKRHCFYVEAWAPRLAPRLRHRSNATSMADPRFPDSMPCNGLAVYIRNLARLQRFFARRTHNGNKCLASAQLPALAIGDTALLSALCARSVLISPGGLWE